MEKLPLSIPKLIHLALDLHKALEASIMLRIIIRRAQPKNTMVKTLDG
jgi:hypothetical protein